MVGGAPLLAARDTTVIDLPLLYRLLDVDEDDGLRALVHKARQTQPALTHLVLSLADLHGYRLASGAADELRRARARAADYTGLCASLREGAGVSFDVMKGPKLAERYPYGVTRPVGDLDLVVEDQPTLWRAAYDIMARRPIEAAGFSLVGEAHMVVTLTWAPQDPILDDDMTVELSNVALPGDFRAIPARAALPSDDPWTGALLCLAEEGLQRPFDAKDAIDLVVLAAEAPADFTSAAMLVERYHLAPEALELLDYGCQATGLDKLADLADALRAPAVREQERRSYVPSGVDTSEVSERLAAGVPVHGLCLRQSDNRRHWTHYRLQAFDGGLLALTPVGDYLLTGVEVVRRADYDAALAELARIEAR
jgi:hypothetical protein